MKNFAFWASRQVVLSRSLLIVGRVLLFGIASFSGVWLFAQSVILPKIVLQIGIVGSVVAFVFYPFHGAAHRFWQPTFLNRKLMDSLFVVSSFLLFIQLFNSDANLVFNEKTAAPLAVLTIYKPAPSESIEPIASKKWSQKELRKELRGHFKTFVSELKTARRAPNTAAQVVGIFFTIILTFVLMYLVVAIACGIACNGQETLAVLVLAAGWALAILLAVKIIQGILRKSTRPLYKPE